MDQYAVVGNPIAHSKSPQIHAEFAKETGQAISYTALLAPVEGFAQTVKSFFDEGGKGLNVTVPFKLEAYEFAQELSAKAEHAGAVNTLIYSEGRIKGDNTDGIGLTRDILQNIRFRIDDTRILLLGAGGASRGVIADLLACCPQKITIANRTLSKAEELAKRFSALGLVDAIGLHEIKGREFDLIINATSTSLQNEVIPIPSKVFARHALAYDMMYGKNLTPFLEIALQSGAQVADGLGMLVEQAAESFFLWRGVRPQTRPVLDKLRGQL